MYTFSVPLNGSTVDQNLKNCWSKGETFKSYCDLCCPESDSKRLPENQKNYIDCKSIGEVIQPSDIIVTAVKRFTNEGRKRFNKVQGNYRIKIANTVYNLKCIITHCGRVITGGCYYADLFMSDGQMVRCNDRDICNITPASGVPKPSQIGCSHM